MSGWILIIAIIAVAILKYHLEEDKPKSQDYDGGSRAGRVALWLFLPPLGLWRSFHHGAEKRNQRLIDEIRKHDPKA